MFPNLKSQFLLDPDVIYLNHGSVGPSPRPVIEAYQHWQWELERQPMRFGGRLRALLAESRAALGRYLGVPGDDVVYFPNPTTAINVVARSLLNGRGPGLRPGDEILTTDHEYGAMDRTWEFVCHYTGACYVHQPMRLPVTTHREFVEAFWSGVNERTRIIFISHVTSPTALIFPVEEICRRAREAGLLSIVDGAHAPGQVPLDLAALGADIYTGACHKWLSGPKGSAFLYARPEVQDWLEPLVISWGWESDQPGRSRFIDYQQWQGTRDMSAFVAVPTAIEFHAVNDWDTVRRECQALAGATRRRIAELTGLEPICSEANGWLGQFFSAPLPSLDTAILKQRLCDEYRIEVPAFRWNNTCFIRVSFYAYNTAEDAETLVRALERLLPELADGS